jgi:16S rRNA (cytosine967-C5)-methyltransferase
MPRRRLSAPDARQLAHDILQRVESTDAFADVVLAHRLADAPLAARDRALVTRLVYGTITWQGRLDHHLGALVRMPLERLEPAVRTALRLGLYQLLFLDRVPVYAAVDGSVRLARAAGTGAAGLVNAVLRRAARAGVEGLALPHPAADPIERLAVEWSHPRWLVERWARELGVTDLTRLLRANNVRGVSAVRANPLRTTRAALAAELEAAGIVTTPSAWAPDALVVERGAARVRGLPAWHEGRLAFQGEASQLIAPLLGAAPGDRILDACAAPGGKTAHLAALSGERGLVVALDARPGGLRIARGEAARLGAPGVRTLAGDARRPPLAGPFDAVLVDAPCTGLGTLRRHPEVRWRRQPADVTRLAALQQAILTGVAPLVGANGVLVYAVCTFTREENEAVVENFLATQPRFALERAPAPSALLTADGYLRTLPHRDGLDGFFAVRLRARP